MRMTRQTMRLALAGEQDEYNYIDPQLLKNWAGPSHWKAITLPSTEQPAATKKRAPKARFTIDFSQPADLEALISTSKIVLV